MKRISPVGILLLTAVLAACSAVPAAHTTPPESATAEETEIRQLIEGFGKRLQTVSLLAPDAAEEIRKQYSEYAAPELLQIWMEDPLKAPGRLTSSPWPDRIEIEAMTKESGGYAVTGYVIEITSVEAANGGEAVRAPVRIFVERIQNRWWITGYVQSRG